MKSRFLLVTDPRKQSWIQIMEEALAPFGNLDIAGVGKVASLIQRERYKIIIIDATHTTNLPRLFLLIREKLQDASVVVATASPDWKSARQAFRLGAVDYIYRSMTLSDLRSRFKAILDQSLKLVS